MSCFSKGDVCTWLSFKDVQDFFKSWGLYPTDEVVDALRDGLNPEVVCEQGINRNCYKKLLVEADEITRGGFESFCARMINATDDSFYLRCKTWAELSESWDKRLPHER